MDEPLTFSQSRIVLVGKTGAGKSSCANTILGRDAFISAVRSCSVTKECSKQTGEVWGRKVTIVDTPGLWDTSFSDETIKREIAKCVNMSAPGPHAIIVVIKAGTLTEEERSAVKKVEEIFGKDSKKYTIVLFTRGDQGDIEKCVEDADEDLKLILRTFGNRYHIFNNKKTSDRKQVGELFRKIDEMVAANNGDYYSNYTYQEVSRMLEDRESKLRGFYEEQLQEEIAVLETKYGKTLSAVFKENLSLRHEIQELKRYYDGLCKNARHVAEQIPDTEDFNYILTRYSKTLSMKND